MQYFDKYKKKKKKKVYIDIKMFAAPWAKGSLKNQ